jgi:hypothetical protein
MINIPMVTLAPKGWVPNPQVTGGNHPPQAIYISYTYWQFLDEPQSIEDYYAKLASLEAKPLINTIDFRGAPAPQEL